MEFNQLEWSLKHRLFDKNVRKEKMQEFIFEKVAIWSRLLLNQERRQKKHNTLKFDEKSKLNYVAMPVPKGTVSVMLNTKSKSNTFNISTTKKKIPTKSKFKMKWKTIQWLIENKKEAIKELCNNSELMGKFTRNSSKESGEGLNRQEFGDLMSYVGLGGDKNLADKLF